jgi:hypothetical protein
MGKDSDILQCIVAHTCSPLSLCRHPPPPPRRFLSVGVTLIFLCLTVKTFRVAKIFGQTRLAVTKISDGMLLKISGAGVAYILLVLLVTSVISSTRPRYDLALTPSLGSAPHTRYYVPQCTGSLETYFLIVIPLVLVLGFSAKQASSLDQIPMAFNEAAAIVSHARKEKQLASMSLYGSVDVHPFSRVLPLSSVSRSSLHAARRLHRLANPLRDL